MISTPQCNIQPEICMSIFSASVPEHICTCENMINYEKSPMQTKRDGRAFPMGLMHSILKYMAVIEQI